MNRLALFGRVAAVTLAAASAVAAPAVAAPTVYTMVAPQSRLQFTGMQAGAPFTAQFHRFGATIAFAADDLADSRFDVQIDMRSADSQDKDRDGTMQGADIFDVARWPTAHYLTKSFARAGAAGYVATGSLTLRGVTRAVPLAFKFSTTPTGAVLTGSATLKRLDFGVGQGDWKSTEWVGNDVKIAFTLVLVPKR